MLHIFTKQWGACPSGRAHAIGLHRAAAGNLRSAADAADREVAWGQKTMSMPLDSGGDS